MNEIQNTLMDILAVAWKDLQVFSKDRGNLVVLFVLPFLLASMFGSVWSSEPGEGGGAPELPIYLVNQDTGPYGAQVADILRDIAALDVEDLDSVDEADQNVADGERLAAVVIPSDFSQKIDAYESTTVLVIVDPVQEQFASIITGIVNEVVTPVVVQGEVQYGIRAVLAESGVLEGADADVQRAVEAQNFGVIMTQLQALQKSPRIAVESSDLEEAEVAAPANLFGMLTPAFTVWFAFFLLPMMAGELLKEKEEGSLRRLLAAPIKRGSILSGKMLAYGLIVVVQVLVIFGVSNIIFDMPLGSSPVGMVLVTLGLALAATSLGMMLAALAQSRRQAEAIGMLLGFVLAGLGGCLIIGLPPLFRREGLLGSLSKFTPHAHALEGYWRLMIEDAGVVDILPQVAVLIGMSVVFFLIARWRFRFQ